jgi:DNA-binding IclR family transcriptional regulator
MTGLTKRLFKAKEQYCSLMTPEHLTVPEPQTDAQAEGDRVTGYGPIAKTVELLALFAAAPPEGMGVRAIARQLALPVSSVHRLLSVLTSAGMVTQSASSRKYSIGVEFYRIAVQVTRGVRLPTLARPVLQRLAAEFNETALLGLYLEAQGQMMFAERVDGTQALQYQIAMLTPLPLVWGASGKSILAYIDQNRVKEIRRSAGRSPGSGAAVPTSAELVAQLAAIRQDGFVVTQSEKLPGARGVAAPVFGPDGVEGCICVTSPADRLSPSIVQRLVERVVQEAAYLSRLNGGDAGSGVGAPAQAWYPTAR